MSRCGSLLLLVVGLASARDKEIRTQGEIQEIENNDLVMSNKLEKYFTTRAPTPAPPTAPPTRSPTNWGEDPRNYWVPCQQGAWSEWGHCSTTCGVGKITRERAFIPAYKNPHFDKRRISAFLLRKAKRNQPFCSYSKSSTQTTIYDEQACSEGGKCPVDCLVTPWSVWNAVAYGGVGANKIVRTRSVSVDPQSGGVVCPSLVEYKHFAGGADCKDGKEVGPWSQCDAHGEQHRTRTDIRCPKEAVLQMRLRMKQVRPCVADAYNKVKWGGDYSNPNVDESTLHPYEFDNLGNLRAKAAAKAAA